MTSPLYYILVALMLMSATISVIFLLVWWFLGRKTYAVSWSLAFAASTGQWISNLNIGAFPSPEAHWLTANGLALMTIVLGLIGHCQRTAYRLKARGVWLIAGLVFGGVNETLRGV